MTTRVSPVTPLRVARSANRSGGAIRKLMAGIVGFRERLLPKYVRRFRKLASHQTPAALFIACSDSRVVPTLLTSAHPGDLFVIRNVGNLIPPATPDGAATGEASAIEYAVLVLEVGDIIICGHSGCGAMKAVMAHGRSDTPNLSMWLRYAEAAAHRIEQGDAIDASLAPHDQASQRNVIVQLDHLASYQVIRERLAAGSLRLHGWWFEIASGGMYAYDPAAGRFELIDRRTARRLLRREAPTARESVH